MDLKKGARGEEVRLLSLRIGMRVSDTLRDEGGDGIEHGKISESELESIPASVAVEASGSGSESDSKRSTEETGDPNLMTFLADLYPESCPRPFPLPSLPEPGFEFLVGVVIADSEKTESTDFFLFRLRFSLPSGDAELLAFGHESESDESEYSTKRVPSFPSSSLSKSFDFDKYVLV